MVKEIYSRIRRVMRVSTLISPTRRNRRERRDLSRANANSRQRRQNRRANRHIRGSTSPTLLFLNQNNELFSFLATRITRFRRFVMRNDCFITSSSLVLTTFIRSARRTKCNFSLNLIRTIR